MNRFQHLVIVDDEPDIGELLNDVFENMFEKITVFSDSTKAYEHIKKSNGTGLANLEECTAIFTDINMPVMNGDKLIRCLRADGIHTPVFFLTGMATKEVILSALRLGVSDVFEKPFDEDQLTKSVSRILEVEVRKAALIAQIIENKTSPEEILKLRRMLGLLQVANERKKTA